MSLLELVAVLVIIGLVATAAITRYGTGTLSNSGSQGVSRNLALALTHARRATIATGDNHFLQLTVAGGKVTSYALYRATGSGDVQVDRTITIPTDVTVTCAATKLEFSFDGHALAGYSVDVAGEDRSWNISVVILTGHVAVTETT